MKWQIKLGNIKYTVMIFNYRYVSICHPLKTDLHLSKAQTNVVIVVIWLLALVVAFFWTSFTEVKMCKLTDQNSKKQLSVLNLYHLKITY